MFYSILNTLGKIFSKQDIEIVFLLFPENRISILSQMEDNLHEMSNPVFEKKNMKKYHQFVCRQLN